MTDQKHAGPQPSDEWAADCMLWRKRILTGSKAHWCMEWDGLPVDETTPEFASCLCFAATPLITSGNPDDTLATDAG